MTEVSLVQMLEAREARAAEQQALQARFPNASLISFTLNIPGPVKNTPAVRRAFRYGCRKLDRLTAAHCLYARHEPDLPTGCTAFYAVDLPALDLKTACVALEDADALGRLFDIDILAPDGRKLDRAEVGKSERGCMVCSAPGRGCASRRLHTVPELQKAAFGRIEGHFCLQDAARIGTAAVRALYDEVDATPKPGLVDRKNNGSHTDMDRLTFHRSADALYDYFRTCASIGMAHRHLPPSEVFPLLRAAGRKAEAAMYAATGGVNTHKGAIYTLGVLSGAIGCLWSVDRPIPDISAILDMAAALTADAVAQDLDAIRRANDPQTAGERLYLQYGLTGIRGEVAAGLPALRQYGLPAFRHALQNGLDREQAGIYSLLHLIAHTDDTTLWHRGGAEGAAYARNAAASLLAEESFPATARLEALDRAFTARRLSPGGSADLLAVLFFLHRLEDDPALHI